MIILFFMCSKSNSNLLQFIPIRLRVRWIFLWITCQCCDGTVVRWWWRTQIIPNKVICISWLQKFDTHLRRLFGFDYLCLRRLLQKIYRAYCYKWCCRLLIWSE
jgi:hypothetical protein